MKSKALTRGSDINRLLAVLNHQTADRIPNFEIWLGPRILSHLSGKETNDDLWSLPPIDAVRIAEMIGQDAVPCSLTWHGCPDGSILSDDDLLKIQIPDPQLAVQAVEKYLDAIEDSDVGLCARLSGPLTLTYMAFGPIPIQSFMFLLYDNLPLVEKVMDMFVDYHIEVIHAISHLPYHFYYIGDDVSSTTGPLISPEFLKSLWAPRAKRLIEAAQQTGKPVIFHCCGSQEPILPYLVEWGVNAVHPIQPVANDIFEIRKKYGDALTLIGNVDIAGVLAFGTPEEVREETSDRIRQIGSEGNYVVCSSHSIIDSVIPENFIAMIETAHNSGVGNL